MKTLSAFLQTVRHNRSNYKSIKTFRYFHPSSDITIYSDNGDIFNDYAEEFNTKFFIDEYNVDPRGKLNYEKLKIYFDRIKQHCINTDSDYVVILEDDVMTYKTISIYPETDCAGPRINPYHPALNQYLQNKFGNKGIYGYGMSGGSIFHREKFLHSISDISRLEELNLLNYLDDRICSYSDVGLTLIFQLSGYKYGVWYDVSEKYHNDPTQIINRDSALDHNDKRLYSNTERDD